MNVPGQDGSDYAGDSGASSYFDVVRTLTRDPDLLAVVDKVEAEWNAERANDAGVVSGA